MQRIAFTMKLFPGNVAEYQRRHNELWPRLQVLLKDAGIKDYSIFLDEESDTLFAYLVVADTKVMDELPHHAVMKEWWAYMKDLMETNLDNSPVTVPLKEVFYLP